MLKRMLMLSAVSLAVASTAGAATLVTWQADGTVVRRVDTLVPPEPGVPIAPPIGAPLSVTLTFDPTSAVPTPFTSLPGCNSLTVSGSVSIGGYSSSIGAISKGYTQSNVPETTCIPAPRTQFVALVPAAPDDSPFQLPFGFLVLSYTDLLVSDAFPNSPTPRFSVEASYYNLEGGGVQWVFDAQTTLRAVDQTTPVPEPATMTLFGLGLAAVYKTRRRNLERGTGEQC